MNAAGTARRDLPGLLEAVCDPEIPGLSIADLGILREAQAEGDVATVVITPTYSGCPAMGVIEEDIRAVLATAGYREVRIETRLAPAWTTDWLTPRGRAHLRLNGIAPPLPRPACGHHAAVGPVPCPRCAGSDTECLSEFGSTACKALYRCRTCREPFDYFKCL